MNIHEGKGLKFVPVINFKMTTIIGILKVLFVF